MPKQSELTLIFNSERRAFLNGDERVVIATAHYADDACHEEVTLKGEALAGDLQRGLTYRFYGHWTTHPKYGRQFAFSTFVAEQPATEEGIVAYLRLAPGVGPGTAYCLWEAFNQEAVAVLRNNPEEAVKVVPKRMRFNIDKARAASEHLKANAAIERAKIDLIGVLDGRGFPRKTIDRAIQKYGSRAAEVVRANPYRLMQFRGGGFLRCDKLFLDLGHSPARLKRQALSGWYAIARDSEGHTWLPLTAAMGAIRQTVAGAEVRAERAVRLAVLAGLLEVRESEGVTWIAERRKAVAEERLAGYVAGGMCE